MRAIMSRKGHLLAIVLPYPFDSNLEFFLSPQLNIRGRTMKCIIMQLIEISAL